MTAGDGRLVRIDLKTTLDVHDVFVLGSEEAITGFAGSDGMLLQQ
jgi:hypothetical protein